MAEHESTTYAAQAAAAANAGSIIADSALISGKSRLLQMQWTAPAGTSTSDTVLMGYLPNGCTVVPGLSTVVMSAAGGAGTHTLGTADDADAISAAVTLNTAGPTLLGGIVPSFENTARQAVILTLGAAVTSGRVVTLNLYLASGE